MNLPKWLVIVGIVIIVLGVLACGIGAVRTFEPPPSSDTPNDTSKDWIPVGEVPIRDVRSENCATPTPTPAPGSRRKGFGGLFCKLTVDPTALQPRDLLLTTSGSGQLSVTQEIRGDRTPARKTFSPGRTFNIRVSGTTPVSVEISQCTFCSVEMREVR